MFATEILNAINNKDKTVVFSDGIDFGDFSPKLFFEVFVSALSESTETKRIRFHQFPIDELNEVLEWLLPEIKRKHTAIDSIELSQLSVESTQTLMAKLPNKIHRLHLEAMNLEATKTVTSALPRKKIVTLSLANMSDDAIQIIVNNLPFSTNKLELSSLKDEAFEIIFKALENKITRPEVKCDHTVPEKWAKLFDGLNSSRKQKVLTIKTISQIEDNQSPETLSINEFAAETCPQTSFFTSLRTAFARNTSTRHVILESDLGISQTRIVMLSLKERKAPLTLGLTGISPSCTESVMKYLAATKVFDLKLCDMNPEAVKIVMNALPGTIITLTLDSLCAESLKIIYDALEKNPRRPKVAYANSIASEWKEKFDRLNLIDPTFRGALPSSLLNVTNAPIPTNPVPPAPYFSLSAIPQNQGNATTTNRNAKRPPNIQGNEEQQANKKSKSGDGAVSAPNSSFSGERLPSINSLLPGILPNTSSSQANLSPQQLPRNTR